MTTFLAAIFVFGLLIATHELGHFSVAKLSGIKVLEFAIGMGPKILKFTRKETDYTLRLLPIGGYVKMLGEEEDSDDPRAFSNQSPWKRLAVIVAGAVFNIITAIILFTLVFMNQNPSNPIVANPKDYTTTISKVAEDSAAMDAGLKVNDKILKVDGKEVLKWDDILSTLKSNKGESVNLTVESDNTTKDIKLTPKYNEKEKRYLVGISPVINAEPTGIFESIKNATTQTFTAIKQMLEFFGTLITGGASMDSLGGPVAIVSMSGQAAQAGFLTLVYFAAFLSINLGVLNLIPFPALDGGWVIILLIEALTGKKIDQNKLGIINFIGFALLMILIVFVTFKDVMRLF